MDPNTPDSNAPAPASAEVKRIADEIGKTFHEWKAEEQKQHAMTREELKASNDKLARIEKDLDAKQDELVEMGKRMDELETAASRVVDAGSDGPEFKDVKALYEKAYGQTSEILEKLEPGDEVKHREAFSEYFQKGYLSPAHRAWAEEKALVLANDASAGFLAAPPAMVSEIIKTVTEMSPIRQFARVISGTTELIRLPKRDSGMTMSWVGESGTRSETTAPTYGQYDIYAHEGYVEPRASRQMLSDSGVDLERELALEAAEAFGDGEGTAFVSGNGVAKPLGITADGEVTSQSVTTAIDFDDLIDAESNIKEAYRSGCLWLFHRTILGSVRKLKDGQGQYLWQPSLIAGQPPLLMGYPVHTADDLANTQTSGDDVAIFGNLQRAYVVYDRMGITLLRDPYSGKSTGAIHFQFYKRVGGKTVLPEAVRYLTIA